MSWELNSLGLSRVSRNSNSSSMPTPPQHGLKTSSYVVICGILSVLGLGLFGFSSSAYAEVTTLTVSNSGETISFDKIKPSGSGTVTKATDSLSVNTNCTEGVDVYLSAINGGSTSLVNDTVTSGNNGEINTLSGTTIGTTALALSNNTWGFNTVDDNTYYGLPTYANAMSHAVYSGTDSSIPIYYGAKVTSSMATGKYNGSVLYTVLVNMNCNNYTVEYDINTPEGAEGSIVSSTPPDDTILTYAKKSKLAENTFEITGYNFLGWSLDPTATTPEYDANTTEYYGSDIALAASADPGGTITMYAIWEEATIYMQDWFGCAKMQTNGIMTLTDSRDNHKYKVKKLPDGNCWMIQNLTISATDMVVDALDNTNTNISASNNGSYYLPPLNTRYAFSDNFTNPAVKSSSDFVNFSSDYSNYVQVGYRAKGATDHSSRDPVPEDTAYYNFYTATFGYLGLAYSGSSPQDICPKGWRLPKISDSGNGYVTAASSEFANLARAYNSNASWTNSDTAANYYTLDSTIHTGMVGGDAFNASNGYAGFTLAGIYQDSGPSSVGSNGYYWSSSIHSDTISWGAIFFPENTYPQYTYYKYFGAAIRCIDQNSSVSGYMQDFNANTELPNESDSTYLIDKRDGNKYAVKRLPDGKVWMTQNLTINGTELTPADTNIADGNTYYLPKDGGAGSITNSATKDATTGYNFTSGSDNQAMFKFRSKASYTNDSDTGYYNFYTATLGYSYNYDGKAAGTSPQDICPKGWRMPRTTNTGATISTIDTSNDFTYLASKYGPINNGTATSSNYYSTDSTVINSIYQYAASPFATTTANNYSGFSYAGYWEGTSFSARDVGSSGRYLSASIYNSANIYYLKFDSSSVYPQETLNKHYGTAVRCIAKPSYTINYDANGGTGEMSPSTGYIGGSIPSKNTFTKDGYHFLGWSTDPSAALPTYLDSAIISADLAPAGNSVTLYAIWGINALMQGWSGCSSMNANDTTSLVDLRDGSTYTVKKINSLCWMTSNLKLGHDKGYTLTNELTNIPSTDSTTYYLPPAGYMGSATSPNTVTSTTVVDFSSSNETYAKVQYRASGTTDNSTGNPVPEDTGYYNFNAATLGFSGYNQSSGGRAPRDICPKGWKLPEGKSSTSYSFYWLDKALGGTGENRTDTTTRDKFLNQALFSYTGSYMEYGLSSIGSYGYWWASDNYGSIYAYGLSLGENGLINPQHYSSKYIGYAVRCVFRP